MQSEHPAPAPRFAGEAPANPGSGGAPQAAPVMRIQALSRLTGATSTAIRLYEGLGLLGPVPRRGSLRLFDAVHAQRVRRVRRAQRWGISLGEMVTALDETGSIDWAGLAERVRQRRARLTQRRRELAALEMELAFAVEELVAYGGLQDAVTPHAAAANAPTMAGAPGPRPFRPSPTPAAGKSSER